jgi:hypothetical protein
LAGFGSPFFFCYNASGAPGVHLWPKRDLVPSRRDAKLRPRSAFGAEGYGSPPKSRPASAPAALVSFYDSFFSRYENDEGKFKVMARAASWRVYSTRNR